MSLQVSATGIALARQRQEVTANNVANLNTPGFRASRVTGGVVRQGDAPPTHTDGPRRSGVDLATEEVNTLVNTETVRANASAFRAQDEAVGTLLDLSR